MNIYREIEERTKVAATVVLVRAVMLPPLLERHIKTEGDRESGIENAEKTILKEREKSSYHCSSAKS